MERDHRHRSRGGGGTRLGLDHRRRGARALTVDLAKVDGSQAEISHRFELRSEGTATRIALLTSKSIPDRDGGIAGWVGTLADVTAEAGAEAAMSEARDRATEASRLKSDFLANMSHEIRTPMNGVIGMADLLLETDLDARQRDYAQTVRNSGEALLTIINNILDFSKVEAGQLEIEDVDFDVMSVVDDVVKLLAGSLPPGGLELVTIVAHSVPDVVTGDPGRVRQVLTNLLGNAIKFTQNGEIVVRVTACEVVGDETVVRFEVSDTGDGIAPTSWPSSSNRSFKPTRPRPESTAARVSGWPSAANWSRSWAATAVCRARSTPGARSGSPFACTPTRRCHRVRSRTTPTSPGSRRWSSMTTPRNAK